MLPGLDNSWQVLQDSCQTDIQIDFPLYYNRNGEKINAAHPVNGKIALDIFSENRYARPKVSDC